MNRSWFRLSFIINNEQFVIDHRGLYWKGIIISNASKINLQQKNLCFKEHFNTIERLKQETTFIFKTFLSFKNVQPSFFQRCLLSSSYFCINQRCALPLSFCAFISKGWHKVLQIGTWQNPFFQLALLARGFSIRILRYG